MAFWDRVDRRDASECWAWNGYRNHDGYGVWHPRAGFKIMAHRASYEELIGRIPPGSVIDHLCRNRSCVNPAHMEPVTRGENVLRGETIPAQHRDAAECPHGHPYSEANTIHRSNGFRGCRECDRQRKRVNR